MKKFLALLMIASLTLVGCSSGGGDSEDVTINVGVEKSYVEYYTQVTDAYTKANPNVKFKITETAMFDLLDSLEAQKGNSADVFMLPNDRIGDLAQKKLIAPVNANLDDYTATAKTAATFEGDTYFVPLSTDTTLLFYNKALTTEIPTALKDINPADWAAKFTDFYVAAGLFYANGAYIFGDENTDIGLANDAAVKTGEAIQSLYASKQAHWEALKEEEAGYNQMVDTFAKGNLKYMIDGPWKVGDLIKAGLAEENIGVVPLPTWDGTEDYQPLTGTKGITVNAYSKNKEEALKFVQSLATKENAEAWYNSTKEVNPHTGVVYEEGTLAKTVLDATSKGTSMPTDPAFGKVWVPMADALKQIANGGDIQKSLTSAVEIIKNDIAAMSK